VNDAWVRIERAKANRERLHTEITAFAATHPDAYRVAAEHDGQGNVTLVARVSKRPPKEWGLIVGDILVDLRSALDYAVYGLAVRHTGQDPPPKARQVEFPIADTDKWFNTSGRRKITDLRSDAVAYIESVQPYQPGYGGPDSALLVLNELVGINKHRFVSVVWAMLKETQLGLTFLNVQLEDFMAYKVDGELTDGTVLATFRMVAQAQYANLQIQPSMTVHVAFEPTSAGFGMEAYTALGAMGGAVEDVVGNLQSYL